MLSKMKITWNVLLVVGASIGSTIMANPGHAANAKDNVAFGRTPTAIVDG